MTQRRMAGPTLEPQAMAKWHKLFRDAIQSRWADPMIAVSREAFDKEHREAVYAADACGYQKMPATSREKVYFCRKS